MYSNVEGIEHPGQEECCNFVKVFGHLRSFKKLEALTFFMKAGVRERQPIMYDHPEHLSSEVNFKNVNEILAALCICGSSPNLRKLEIMVYSDEEVLTIPIESFWEVQYHLDILFKNLKIVKITEMSGTKSVLEFIKFVLARASVLETMNIAIKKKMVSKELKIFMELMRFRRASTQAELIYSGSSSMETGDVPEDAGDADFIPPQVAQGPAHYAFDERLTGLRQHLDARFDALEAHLDAHFDALRGRIHQLSERFATFVSRFDQQFPYQPPLWQPVFFRCFILFIFLLMLHCPFLLD